jgi:hypothetical protein
LRISSISGRSSAAPVGAATNEPVP